MQNTNWAVLAVFLSGLMACRQAAHPTVQSYRGWTTFAGSPDGIRYSSNDGINTGNVARLQVAWTYSTHDKDTGNRSQNQCTPIVIEGVLYGVSPRLQLFALDAATGRQQWLFDPAAEDAAAAGDPAAFYKVSRGVAYWQDEAGEDRRIFYNAGEKTYAINAATGKPIRTFGKGGFIDLSENLDREGGFNPFVAGTTPGIIYKDLLIIGMRLAESADAAPGHIRAFDVRTGEKSPLCIFPNAVISTGFFCCASASPTIRRVTRCL